MRIYLDNCCYNRPYDTPSDFYLSLEISSKLEIQKRIQNGNYELVTSYVLAYECSRNIKMPQSKEIVNFINENSKYYVDITKKNNIRELAEKIKLTGIHDMDAEHIASAIYANCEYFITTDKRLFKYITDEIKIVNPVKFIELERKC